MKLFDATVLSHDLHVHKRHAVEIRRDSLTNHLLIALSFSELLRMKPTTRRIIVFDPSESLWIFNVIFDFCERDGNKKCK